MREGLSAGGGGAYVGKNNGKWDDSSGRQNKTEWKSYTWKMKKMYHIICLFAHWRKFVPGLVPLWLKNRNQRIHAGGPMRRGLYTE